MYISKMIFIERKEIHDTFYNILQDEGIICNTDYGTTEITSDSIKDFINNNKEYESVENYTKELTQEFLSENLGRDVITAMLEDKLDFIQIIY